MPWIGRRGAELDALDRRDPAAVEQLAEWLREPLARAFRPQLRGLEHYPVGEPALVVGNHSGGALTPDTWLFGEAIRAHHGVEELPYGLAHELVLNLPVLGPWLTRLGAVRASHHNARGLFEGGHKVMVYPGGDVESMRPYRDRNRIVFDGRQGYVRLAIRCGVPIVPVVSAGSHAGMIILSDGRWLARALGLDRRLRLKVMPIALSLPWGLTIGPVPPYLPLPTRVCIEILPPLRFDRAGPAAAADASYVARCDERVRTAMQRSLSTMAAELEREAAERASPRGRPHPSEEPTRR